MPLNEQDKQEIAQLIARAIADAKEPPPPKTKPPLPTRFMVAGADVNTVGHAGPNLPQIVNFQSGFSASQSAGTENQLNVIATGGGSGSIITTEFDGVPSVPTTSMIFPNGTVVNAGGGNAQVNVEPAGAVAAHLAASDPHPQYENETSLAAEPFVTYGPSANLTSARQYINAGAAIPSNATSPDGGFFYHTGTDALYVNDTITWRAPQAMKVYTSLGESPSTGDSF